MCFLLCVHKISAATAAKIITRVAVKMPKCAILCTSLTPTVRAENKIDNLQFKVIVYY